MSQFDDALALRLIEEGLWLGFADPRYEAMTGMYGGWTAAELLRAVMLAADPLYTPCALTINFIQKVEPGKDVSSESGASVEAARSSIGRPKFCKRRRGQSWRMRCWCWRRAVKPTATPSH